MNFLNLFLCFLLSAGLYGQIEISWQGERAVSIYLDNPETGSASEYEIFLKGAHGPVFGNWSQQGKKWKFQPIVPFTPGLSYHIRSASMVLDSFTINRDFHPQTEVINVYPSCDTVPENLLKIYVSFSNPMGEQLSERFIRVTNGVGDTLENIFLPLQPELWNETHDQLTLWLDPGRIKRDLGPNRTWGSPLQESQTYRMEISAGWKDQNGYPLVNSYEKKYVSGQAIRTIPNPNAWSIVVPSCQSLDTCKIIFERPMDFVLVQECIKLFGPDQVSGTIGCKNQREWTFVPDRPWQSGSYRIAIESRLEDLAGNNLNRPFDLEVKSEQEAITDAEYHFLYFQIP